MWHIRHFKVELTNLDEWNPQGLNIFMVKLFMMKTVGTCWQSIWPNIVFIFIFMVNLKLVFLSLQYKVCVGKTCEIVGVIELKLSLYISSDHSWIHMWNAVAIYTECPGTFWNRFEELLLKFLSILRIR